jgi:hypothetical protein
LTISQFLAIKTILEIKNTRSTINFMSSPSISFNWNNGLTLNWANSPKNQPMPATTHQEIITISQDSIDSLQEDTQIIDRQAIGDLFKRKNGLFFEELAGTWFTYRHDWGEKKGQWLLHLNWEEIEPNSRIFVTIAEGSPTGEKIIGRAKFSLHNVVPSKGTISIWVDIQWHEPLCLHADYLVINK